MTTAAESKPPRPDVLSPQIDSIPPELRELPQWVGWRLALRQKGKGKWKWTKEPLNARTGALASTTNPPTWSSLGEVLTAFRDGLGDGIGFVFSEDGPHFGVDLDHCCNPETGAIEPWAQDIIDRLSSFTEISPTRTGVHLILQGELAPKGRRRAGVEMYSEGRYFTVTGHAAPGTPTKIEERTAEIAKIHAETFDEPQAKPTSGASPNVSAPSADIDLIEKAFRATNGAKLRGLFGGDISGYDSQSEADLALCGLLAFWTGPDPARIDRLFRRSGLFRDKWDERRASDGRTYGEITIQTALASPREQYGDRAHLAVVPT